MLDRCSFGIAIAVPSPLTFTVSAAFITDEGTWVDVNVNGPADALAGFAA